MSPRTRAIRTILRVFLLPLLVLATTAAATFYLEPLWVNDHMISWKLWRLGVQSHYVTADGHRIHYFEAHPPADVPAPGGGIPLVLIHGLGARGEVWSPLIPTLAAQGFHVYVPDLLGFGRSDQPDVDYSMRLQEQTMLAFLDAVHLQHADLAGWSMGGWVSLRIALDHPERVNRLVVFDAAGTYFPPSFEASLFTPSDAAGLAHLAARLSPIRKPPFPGFVSRDAVAMLRRNGWIIQRSMASMETGRDLLDFHLHQLSKPTLIVWGSLDDLIPLPAGQQLHRNIRGSSLLVLAGCGHLAAGECARPLLPPMVEFLKASPELPPFESTLNGINP